MKVIYVAGKYTAPTIEGVIDNVAKAEEAGKEVLAAGHVPLIPHCISAHWDIDSRFTHFEHGDWLNKFCYPLLKKCDGIYLYDGWEESKGAQMEYEVAKLHGIPIYFSVEDI